MANFWDIYENMQEIVYVTDPSDYTVVYINKYGRDRFGYSSNDEIKGRPCYEILRNCDSRCSICTNDELKPGQFLEWRYYNPLHEKTYLMKDTLVEQDGKLYKLELAIDISESDSQTKAISEFTSNETMVNDALRLSLSQATPEKSIDVLLKHLGHSLKSERVYIFEDMEDGTVRNTYEWCAGGVEPQREHLQNVPFEVVSLWYESFEKNENIIVESLESIKYSHPRTYETLLPQQIDSLVVSPLIINGKIIGFYGVDNPPKEFLNHISVMFMILGYFIASILKRRNLVDRLAKLSYYDQLTGALNRHGMNEFIANIDHNASIGIIYCDVMGLKQVNDTDGHLAGDALLTRSYECLRGIFPSNTVFRIGGDEFLAMSSNVTYEDMKDKVRLVKESMKKYGTMFAVGAVWEEHCNGRISELLKLADERMYVDKAKYYENHSNDRLGKRSVTSDNNT